MSKNSAPRGMLAQERKYEVEHATRVLLEAESIRKDKGLMKSVKTDAKKKAAQLSKLSKKK